MNYFEYENCYYKFSSSLWIIDNEYPYYLLINYDKTCADYHTFHLFGLNENNISKVPFWKLNQTTRNFI